LAIRFTRNSFFIFFFIYIFIISFDVSFIGLRFFKKKNPTNEWLFPSTWLKVFHLFFAYDLISFSGKDLIEVQVTVDVLIPSPFPLWWLSSKNWQAKALHLLIYWMNLRVLIDLCYSHWIILYMICLKFLPLAFWKTNI
jgi:hypothetical protein